MASDSARREDNFQKKLVLVSKIYFGRKMDVCCLFCLLFDATLSDFGILFFLIEAFVELRKMFSRKKLYHARFGNCSTPTQPLGKEPFGRWEPFGIHNSSGFPNRIPAISLKNVQVGAVSSSTVYSVFAYLHLCSFLGTSKPLLNSKN